MGGVGQQAKRGSRTREGGGPGKQIASACLCHPPGRTWAEAAAACIHRACPPAALRPQHVYATHPPRVYQPGRLHVSPGTPRRPFHPSTNACLSGPHTTRKHTHAQPFIPTCHPHPCPPHPTPPHLHQCNPTHIPHPWVYFFHAGSAATSRTKAGSACPACTGSSARPAC